MINNKPHTEHSTTYSKPLKHKIGQRTFGGTIKPRLHPWGVSHIAKQLRANFYAFCYQFFNHQVLPGAVMVEIKTQARKKHIDP